MKTLSIILLLVCCCNLQLKAVDTTEIHIKSIELIDLNHIVSNTDIIAIAKIISISPVWIAEYDKRIVINFEIDSILKGEYQTKSVNIIASEAMQIPLIDEYKDDNDKFFNKKRMIFFNTNYNQKFNYFINNDLCDSLLSNDYDEALNIFKKYQKDGYFKIIFDENEKGYSKKTIEGHCRNGKPFGYWKFRQYLPSNYDSTIFQDKYCEITGNYQYFNEKGKQDSSEYDIFCGDTIRIMQWKNGTRIAYINFENGKRTSIDTTLDENNYLEINYDSIGNVIDSSKISLIETGLRKYQSISTKLFKRWDQTKKEYFLNHCENNYYFYYPYNLNIKRSYDMDNKLKETGTYIEANALDDGPKSIGNHIYYDSAGNPIKIEEYDETGKLIRKFNVQIK